MNRHLRLVCLLSLVLLSGPTVRTCLAHPEDHAGTLLRGAIFPRLTRSGESVVFSYQGAIWRMPRGGGEMRQLTDDPGFDVEPAWSPDEKLVAFIRGRNSFSGSVRIVHADTGEAIKLPRDVIAKDKLFFHPDGTRLLGCFRREGGRFAVCWLDWKSGELGPELRADEWGLRYALSHDGSRIALATSKDVRGEQGGNNGPQCDLHVMPAEGGTPQTITQFPGRVYELTWGADRQSLLVVSNVGGVHNDLWEVPLEEPDKGARKLTFGQADEDRASVSIDGRWMLFTDNRLGPTLVMVRDYQNHHEHPLRVSERTYRKAAGTLNLTLSENSQPVTARVVVQQVDGKYYTPHDALYRMLNGDVHFYADGKARTEVPAGQYLVKIARGPEYPVERREVEVTAGQTTDLRVELKRWTHQRARGWHSGESHIHANYGYGQWYNSPRTMLLQGAGEDLNVCNFMVANSEADGVFDREYFRGAPDPLSTDDTVLYWNQEFRSTIWGHLTLLNLKQLVEPIFTGFAHTTHPHDHPTNADIADLTHDQDGHVNYTHPAHNVKDPYLSAYSAKALPMDVALGKVDSIDVMGSNHVATMPLWYRLLNCGFRIPASAGTDCFLNRVRSRLPGQDRVYVFLEDEFSYERWVQGLKAGRTFVTNGPMLEFQVNEQLAGSVLELQAPQKLRVTGRVTSQYPLDRVEIVVNGEVIDTVPLENPSLEVAIDRQVDISGSGWIALRAGGPGHPDQPGGSVFAHSSPVYVQVVARPLDTRDDAAYFVAWIDRLREDIRRRNRVPSRHQVGVEEQLAAARAVFNRLLAPPASGGQ